MLYLLLFFSWVLTAAVLTWPVWPKYISFQNKIDPNNLHYDYDPWVVSGIFNNKKVPVPQDEPRVLGESNTIAVNNSSKYVEVDLTTQRAFTFENGQRLKEYIISSGKWDRTPIGTFTIWTKIRSQKMSGGSKLTGDYYYLPNVPYIMFFYNAAHPKTAGFSLHGTYWHHNFGVPMSHGCINMKTEDAAEVFSWADVGTEVRIYGKYIGKTALK